MGLAAEISALELPRGVFRGAEAAVEPILPLGLGALDGVLPGGGLSRGVVTELAASSSALATTLALAACRSAQEQAQRVGGELPWCAFIDPSRSLFAPGVAAAGVRLERLLVVRPSLEALARTALRVVESRAFAVVAIDTCGVPGGSLEPSLGSFARVVRRLSIAVEATSSVVILITDRDARRPLPLPVAQRIELFRPNEQQLSVRVAKDRRGRVASPKTIHWVRPAPGGGDARLAG